MEKSVTSKTFAGTDGAERSLEAPVPSGTALMVSGVSVIPRE